MSRGTLGTSAVVRRVEREMGQVQEAHQQGPIPGGEIICDIEYLAMRHRGEGRMGEVSGRQSVQKAVKPFQWKAKRRYVG
jgi:hypothetical protein